MDRQFHIRQLACAYRPERDVLHIEDLSIERGQLVFILGISGIGKSTLIESLGLMNNINRKKQETQITFFSQSGQTLEMKNLWDGDNRDISHFRNRYFSFIFQNTNLMPHFSAGENMCISQLISGKTLAEAKPVVRSVMQALNLPDDIFDRKITELSGGQRQRLAFVRAITAEFEVLFGDEPTGNLDRDTGIRLMRVLRQNLAEHRRTGIIVSHDIELALLFADQIILLTPEQTANSEEPCGAIRAENCLTRSDKGWSNFSDDTVADPLAHINRILGIKTPSPAHRHD